jgi:hypothetical protein
MVKVGQMTSEMLDILRSFLIKHDLIHAFTECQQPNWYSKHKIFYNVITSSVNFSVEEPRLKGNKTFVEWSEVQHEFSKLVTTQYRDLALKDLGISHQELMKELLKPISPRIKLLNKLNS